MKKIHFIKTLFVNSQPCWLCFVLKFESVEDSIENVYLIPCSQFNRLHAENIIKHSKDYYAVKPSAISGYKLSKSLACVLVDM